MLNRGTQALLCILRSMSVARFTGVVPLLYCADAFKAVSYTHLTLPTTPYV